MIPIDHRLTRLEQMIEEYRAAKKRQLLQRAIKLWRRTEAQLKLAEIERGLERSH